MIKLIIFDLDGTLYDDKQTYKEFLKILRKKFKLKKEISVGIFQKIKKRIRRNKEIKDEEKFWNLVFSDLFKAAGGVYNKKYREVVWDCFDEAKNSAKPYPRVKELLERIKRKNIKTVILTGAMQSKNIVYDKKFFEKIHSKKISDKRYILLEKMSIAKYFDEIFEGYEIGYLKPSKESFLYVINKMGVSPKETIMIGDNVLDMEARNFGISTILIDRKGKYREDFIEPSFTIKNFGECLRLLENQGII